MLQAFYWDSFNDTQWAKLERQADDLASTFSLVWIPQSGNCGSVSMGYDDLWWFNDYNSSFGNEQQLRSMIQTFRSKGIGTIADVVVNHRRNVSNWVDFPKETYKGVTYEMTAADICNDDDGGATRQWATANGYTLSSNKDTGEGWGGMRDLDHKSQNVQTIVKAYLGFLLNDLGYAGFRYDMVKGYSGAYTKLYNESSKPQFSVGECWDGTSTIRRWIDATEKTSAAFDFQFRYTVRNAINGNNWTLLGKQNEGNWPLVSSNVENGAYRQYAVTFVENHDTERRSNSAQDPIVRDTLAANAYMLAMPGTPCIFLKHWQAYHSELKAMVEARRLAGLQNLSQTVNMASRTDYYAVRTTGTNGNLVAVVGNGADSYQPNGEWTRILSGYHYAYYLSNTMNTAWADLASGTYEGQQQVRLLAVSSDTKARLVYTLDGTEPTAASTAVSSGTTITIPVGTTTLKAGLLLDNGTVTGIVIRQYSIEDFAPYDITVYVAADKVNWSDVNFWTWGGTGNHAPKNATWPGDRVTQTATVGQRQWYTQQYTITKADDFVNFVFSTGTGSPQTVNVENVNQTSFFEIATTKSGNNHQVNDVTADFLAGIAAVAASVTDGPVRVYTAGGRIAAVWPSGTTAGQALLLLRPGTYIINGKKYIK